MAAENINDLDPDEDLFQFDDLRGDATMEDEDADLDEIFATFNDREFDPPPSVDVPVEVPPAPVRAPEPIPAPKSAASAPELVAPAKARIQEPAPPTPEPAAPTYIPAPAAAAPARTETRVKLSPSVLLILAAITAMNGLVALISMKSSNDVRTSIQDVGDELGSLTSETIGLARNAEQALRHSRDPFDLGIDPTNHPQLAEIEEDIRGGDFERARRRLYSLLSILDRLEPARRAELERRATFLLGSARHLEALQRAEQERQ